MADDEPPILVTGGTGTLGRALVHTLLDAGRPVRVLSRRPRTPAVPDAVEWVVGDLLTGHGLPESLAGVRTVVHCASDPRKPDHDLDAAVQLLVACRAAHVEHLVYISIVGVDAVELALYGVKRRVEEFVEDGGIPWTILRATQFHDFVANLLDSLSRGPVAVLPTDLQDQPVDVREVAARLLELVEAGPSGRVADLGGPQILDVAELMRTFLDATGRRRPVWSVPVPGRLRGFRDGGHLTPEHADGRVTFAEWLGASSRRL